MKGDTISPMLFTAYLDEFYRRIGWDESAIEVNGEYLIKLLEIFTHGIAFFSA